MYTEMAAESDDSVGEIIRAAVSFLGYAEIRLQETAVRAFVTGSDVFLSRPTGGGKSLCYAVLPRVLDMLRGNDTPQSLSSVSRGVIWVFEHLPWQPLACATREDSYANPEIFFVPFAQRTLPLGPR